MSYIKINDNCQVECIRNGNEYAFYFKENDEDPYFIGSNSKSPLQHSKSSNIGKQIYTQVTKRNDLTIRKDQDWDEVYIKEFNKLLESLEADLALLEKQQLQEQKTEEKNKAQKYMHLASSFEGECQVHSFNPLQYIVRVFEAMSVDSEAELIKAFIGFLQTILGAKGTNVIAIGSQSSGKTHCIESALKLLPEDNVHIGVYSKASFFKEFNGQDLTGHVFYMGDLGGDNDDERTIEMRDVFKQLSTDGIAQRSLVDTNSNESVTEVVYGYPAISYTTVNEEIINEQERSRSVIIYPPEVDKRKLMVYDSFNEAPGSEYQLLNDIKEAVELCKGFVWQLQQEMDNYELFNPYMFAVQHFLRNMPDFNRKIKEFNKDLLIVCILKRGFKLEHSWYNPVGTEDEDKVKTTLLIASKEDVFDALTIFAGSTGLLPTELAVAKGLLKKYDPVPLTPNDSNQTTFDYDINYEKEVVKDFERKLNEMGTTRVGDVDNGATRWDEIEYMGVDNDGEPIILDCLFTVESLRKKYNKQRWYSGDISSKLLKLNYYGFLIKVGNFKKYNIYALNHNSADLVNDAKPKFRKDLTDMGVNEFHRKYPDLVKEFDEFIEVDRNKKDVKGTTLEIDNDSLFELPWKGVKDDDL